MSTPAQATDIVFTRHGARRGIAWLTEAFAMFRRAKAAWIGLIALYYLLMFLANAVPLIGQLALPLLKPIFAVGLLAAAWTQERGGKPAPSLLFHGFRANVRALIPLGIVMAVGGTLAVLGTQLFDGGLLMKMISGEVKSTEEVEQSGALPLSLAALGLLLLPTTLALWFAPALVVFQDARAGTAMAASLRAALANWRPLVTFGLAVIFAGIMLPLVLAQFLVMALPSQGTVLGVQMALLLYGFAFAATLHIADYLCYRDVFHAGETLAPLAPGARH